MSKQELSQAEISLACAKYQKLKAYDALFAKRKAYVDNALITFYNEKSGSSFEVLKMEAKEIVQ